MNLKRITEGLNEAQREAVLASDGAVLVVAGPGTGKTLTIIRRIAYLIEKGVKAENIIALTFTNRAANELKERIKTFSKDTDGLFAGTFHLFGLKLIKENTDEGYSIIGRDEQLEIIKGIDSKNPSKVLEKISRIKNLLDEPVKDFKGFLDQYQRVLEERRVLDLDDLLWKAFSLLTTETVLNRYRDRYLIVDEYQDINPLQYRLLKRLSPVKIFAVGDPDQSIYAFRGANVKNFLDFERDYPGAKRIILDRNYRSQAFIVRASESLIEKNIERIPRKIIPVKGPLPFEIPKEAEGSRREISKNSLQPMAYRLIYKEFEGLCPSNSSALAVKVVSVPDEGGEVEFIVKEVEKRLGGTSHYSLMKGLSGVNGQDYRLSDFAILARTNYQLSHLESGLKRAGIPCFITGRAFNDELRAILSYITENKEKPFEDLLPELKERYKLINSFLRNYRPSCIDDLINLLHLIDSEEETIHADGVKLLTMHMAKGLEFRIVFISGLEEGLIPYKEEEIEEERRLLYVAMTRAKDELLLIHARKREVFRKDLTQKPSRFLQEIEEEYLQRLFIPDRPVKDRQLGLF